MTMHIQSAPRYTSGGSRAARRPDGSFTIRAHTPGLISYMRPAFTRLSTVRTAASSGISRKSLRCLIVTRDSGSCTIRSTTNRITLHGVACRGGQLPPSIRAKSEYPPGTYRELRKEVLKGTVKTVFEYGPGTSQKSREQQSRGRYRIVALWLWYRANSSSRPNDLGILAILDLRPRPGRSTLITPCFHFAPMP
jgi:hypothetical protein